MTKQLSNKKWKRISSEMALDEKWFRVRKDVVELPNGTVLDDYFLWLSEDVSLVVPVTKNNEFILVKQYKYGANEEMIEFPAGYIEENEKPKNAATRELGEETGYSTDDIRLMAEFAISPTKADGKVFIYLAKNVINDKKTKLDISEDIEIMVRSFEEVMKMIKVGEIKCGDSIAAFFLASKKLGLI